MVEHTINNHTHSPCMAVVDQLSKIFIRTETGINVMIIQQIVLVVLPCCKNRIHVNAGSTQFLNVIQILDHAAQRSAEFSARDLTVPLFFGWFARDKAATCGETVREDIVNHCILRPGRRCCNVCRMVKRQLVVFRSVVHAVICKEIAVIQQLLRSVVKFKIVTDPLIGAFQDDLEVIKPFVLRFHLHLYRRENNRCQAAGSICIKQRAVL